MSPQQFVVILLAMFSLALLAKSDTAAPRQAVDDSNVRVKRTDDVSVSSLHTLVEQQQALLEQQASVIQTVQAELAASRSRVSGVERGLTYLEARVDSLSWAGQYVCIGLP